jgi:hypothetical protein
MSARCPKVVILALLAIGDEATGSSVTIASLPGQPVFEVACQLTYIGGVAESFQLMFCGFDVDAQALADLMLHLEHSREFLLREHPNLEVEVRAFLRLTRHAVLTDENEDCKHNTLRGDNQRQNSKRKWIEGFRAGNQAEIDRAPGEHE